MKGQGAFVKEEKKERKEVLGRGLEGGGEVLVGEDIGG